MKIICANITLLMLFFTQGNIVCAQNDSLPSQVSYMPVYKDIKKTEILAGMSWQGNWHDNTNAKEGTFRYVEFGIARSVHADSRHGPASMGVYLSEELHLGRKYIYGTKVGVYTHYLFDLGFSMIYYTDFKRGNFKLRPEIGLGMGVVRIVLGFNIPTIANKDFMELQKKNAQVAVQFFLPVKKKTLNEKGTIIKQLFKNLI